MPVYLDCNATTPVEDAVRQEILKYLGEEFGNAGSRTHVYGTRAKQAVERAREQVARLVAADRDEVIFTSGATESNNLAILGLAPFGDACGRKHIVSSQIEHKAVLEPLEELQRRGFQVTLVPPTRGGWVDPETIKNALRPDTLLVSLMHVNNETGVIQPIESVANILSDHPAFFHTDAAQGYGKDLAPLRNARIDLISISAHKIFGPKGVGALVARRRGFEFPPLEPLLFGGGQERGLRPGTQPVFLIAGLGKAAELAADGTERRANICRAFKTRLLAALEPAGAIVHGDIDRLQPHVVNLSFPGLDSEAVMLALKDLVAISNGSACTSSSYKPSHVLRAMGLTEDEGRCALRWSWCHMTETPDWEEVVAAIKRLV